ncbi:MAG: polyphosphate polymerase domain-containing protein [Eubacteriales bacterium]
MQARHEYKHSLNYLDYSVLKGRLDKILPHDSNAGSDGEYLVRSLYFDTPGDKALREKIDGTNRREKFRIRRYGDNTVDLKLEKKSKVNGLCYKKSTPLSPDEVSAICTGDTGWMVTDGRELVVELYSKMKGQCLCPKTIVEYVREPFVCSAGNVRITFDRDIRTGLLSTDFLNNILPVVPVGNELVLLEVKYDAFIPDFLVKLLNIEGRRASACSKYALSRIYG